jgi:hypothetical protein
MVESLTYTYTTQAEMESIFSATGVSLHTDDDTPDSITEAIEEATDEINLFCLEEYDAADLNQNKWVRRMASYIACQIISIRRGQAELYSSKVDQIFKRLERIKSGSLEIPRLAKRTKGGPVMSNLRVDFRYRQNSIRTEQGTRVGNNWSGEPADYLFLWR